MLQATQQLFDISRQAFFSIGPSESGTLPESSSHSIPANVALGDLDRDMRLVLEDMMVAYVVVQRIRPHLSTKILPRSAPRCS